MPELAKSDEIDQQNNSPTEKRNTTLSAARMEKLHSQELREQSLLPKHQKAIQMGLKGLKVEDLMKEGVGDDAVSMSSIGSQVFRGTIKKLPHIIGTSYFFHDPWIGLFEEDEQRLETNEEAFTTVFEAKDAPKPGESPSNTISNPPAYAPPVPPPMQKNLPPLPPTNMPPPPPPPPAPVQFSAPKGGPPPPPPVPVQFSAPKGGPPPPPAVAPTATFNNFQKGLAATLERRKHIIDGDITGDLSVKNILSDESKALGLPSNPPKAPLSKPLNQPTSNPIPNPPQAYVEKPVVLESYSEEKPKKPEQMTLEDKKRQLAGILGGGPMMRPKPEAPESQNSNLYQQPPPDTSYQNPPQNLYQAPPVPPTQNPTLLSANKPVDPIKRPTTQAFLPNIEEEDELNSLFKPNVKPVQKEKKNFSGLFDTPQEEEKKSSKNEPRKTRAEGLFKFIEDDDADTASLLLNSDLAKKKLGKTTTESPFLFKPAAENPLLFKPENPKILENPKSESNPFMSSKPPVKKDSDGPLFKASPSDDPLSNFGGKIATAFSPTSENKSPRPSLKTTEVPSRPSIKDMQANMPMPLFGGPPPRQDKPAEVSHDITMSRPVRNRVTKAVTSKFDEFDDESTLIKSNSTISSGPRSTTPVKERNVSPMNRPSLNNPPANRPSLNDPPASRPSLNNPPANRPSNVEKESDPLAVKMPSFSSEPLPSFGQPKPQQTAPASKPLPSIRNVSPKPVGSSRREVNFDPLMGGFRGPEKKPTPRPSVNTEEEKKNKSRSLFEEDEEISFRPPAKKTEKNDSGARKQRGSLFDD